MADAVAACRVCLAVDVRLLTIAGALQLVYEKITSNALHSEGKPLAACYICYAQLDKCRKLMLTCALAENVLNDMLHRQVEITTEAISLIDRKAQGLCGSLTCSGALHHSGIQTPVEVKTELKLDMAKTDPIRPKVEPEEVFADALQPDNFRDLECCSDEEPFSLSQLCHTEMDMTEQRERGEDITLAETSGVGKRKQAKGITTTTDSKQRESRQESTTETARGHWCDVCQRWFRYNSDMMRHYRTHTGEKPFQCNICNYRCTVKSSLLSHFRTHTGEKPFQCNICGYRCKVKSSLLCHLRTHSGEKPYQCGVCQHRFKQKGHLVEHARTHTGEKPFQCDVCDYCCSQKSDLLKHSRTHSGEKPFQCHMCNYSCIQKYSLLQHIRTHR
ncbi:zinc finger protein with KRAB and SCAN domains 8-like [Plodia interpunctella]|uniref:zinc finger protein with KRAB and SCAN domains 8-like n=1 Tax=Plodia interpunctella TaxID=58824 RepID=UPI0023680141|nr:zinc finger protein with KRAB and SCAN domains 8-like [Plodia interpunctella]